MPILIAKLAGIFIVIVGVYILIRPEAIKAMITFWKQGKRMYIGGLIRFLFGVVLLLAVREAREPTVMMVLGILFVVMAVMVFVLGLDRIRKMVGWWENRPTWACRALSVVTVLFGVVIIYSA